MGFNGVSFAPLINRSAWSAAAGPRPVEQLSMHCRGRDSSTTYAVGQISVWIVDGGVTD